MFIGSAIAELFRKRQQGGLVVPIASGFIAGESLWGVAFAALTVRGYVS
jgi:uncharacterized oligopeptide transporter (OPT) family protein